MHAYRQPFNESEASDAANRLGLIVGPLRPGPPVDPADTGALQISAGHMGMVLADLARKIHDGDIAGDHTDTVGLWEWLTNYINTNRDPSYPYDPVQRIEAKMAQWGIPVPAQSQGAFQAPIIVGGQTVTPVDPASLPPPHQGP